MISTNTILKRLYRYCNEANLEKRSPHKIRKTFASRLVNSGAMDLSEVASIMGHVDEKTLISHYLYSTKSKDTRLERMEECLVG
ncbi:MAG: tyrosine-type recombinase/integrase [Acetatifactor sp.]|nr:tyrosine-type recombinase/integrase [Acetatifactor sp.]